MAREQEFNADKVFNNQLDQLDADFAQAIRDIHDGLSSETGSPVYTGFLASSWKVRREPIDQTDAREDFEPWASIINDHDLPKGGEGWKPAGSSPDNPVIVVLLVLIINLERQIFILETLLNMQVMQQKIL